MGYLKRLDDKRIESSTTFFRQTESTSDSRRETLEGVTKQEAETILAQRKAEVTKQSAGNRERRTGQGRDHASNCSKGSSAKADEERGNTLGDTKRSSALPETAVRIKRRGSSSHSTSQTPTRTGGKRPRRRKAVSAKTIRHVHELLRNILTGEYEGSS